RALSAVLLHHLDLERRGHGRVQTNRHLDRTELLDRLGELNPPPIDRDAGTLEGIFDVLRRHRAVHLALVADDTLDAHAHALELLRELLGGLDFLRRTRRGGALELVHALQAALGRHDGETARPQKVPRVSRATPRD